MLDIIGSWLGMLLLHLFIAYEISYEFWQSGLEKFRGTNWFAHIQTQFPLPFSVVPVEISWPLATWVELIGAVMWSWLGHTLLGVLVCGPGYRRLVRGACEQRYNVCDNGYKLPLMYLVMLIPLVLVGPGKLSIDYWLRSRFTRA